LVGLLVIAGIIAAVVLTGGDDDNGTASPTGSTTTTTSGEPASLISFVMPTQDSRGCTKEPEAVPPAVETYTCDPSENAPTAYPDNLQISFYANASDLQQAFQAAKADMTEAACGAVVGERVWIHTATGKRGGRRFCATNADGEFTVVWTHEKLGAPDHAETLGIASEPGRSPLLFQSWWNSANDNIGKCRPKASEQDCFAAIEKLKQSVRDQ
jgi:hypothetical protein